MRVGVVDVPFCCARAVRRNPSVLYSLNMTTNASMQVLMFSFTCSEKPEVLPISEDGLPPVDWYVREYSNPFTNMIAIERHTCEMAATSSCNFLVADSSANEDPSVDDEREGII